jgi:hypothetical protein
MHWGLAAGERNTGRHWADYWETAWRSLGWAGDELSLRASRRGTGTCLGPWATRRNIGTTLRLALEEKQETAGWHSETLEERSASDLHLEVHWAGTQDSNWEMHWDLRLVKHWEPRRGTMGLLAGPGLTWRGSLGDELETYGEAT